MKTIVIQIKQKATLSNNKSNKKTLCVVDAAWKRRARLQIPAWNKLR